jgi:hypothetical protein
MPYHAIYNLTAEGSQRNNSYSRSAFSRASIARRSTRCVSAGQNAPLGHSFVQFRPLGGAMARVAQSATAFAHRDANFMVAIAAAGGRAQRGEAQAWVRGLWSALQPKSSGVYVNFLSDDGGARIRRLSGRELRAPGRRSSASTTRVTCSR